MSILLRSLIALFAAVFAGGLFLVTTSGATAVPEERAVIAKRQDAVSELATVDDDEDDANRDKTNTRLKTRSKTGTARPATAGAPGTTPQAGSHTNDGSRHDTR